MRHAAVAGLLVAALLAPLPAAAQQRAEQRLAAEREALERIRRERAQLEERMRGLRNTVHDLSQEVELLERQAEATSRVVRSLDGQLLAINAEVDSATTGLVRAEDELAAKRAILRRRLADIYKRGPLYDAEVLLSAASFGDLVARYKYLHLLARRDKALVARVEHLRDQIDRQRRLLVRLQRDIETNRSEKAREEQRLRVLEQQRERSLVQAKRSARQTEQRLKRIAADEERLANVIANLEAERRRAEAAARASGRRGAATAPNTLSSRSAGQFDWPVTGDLLYRFGRVVNPNNTATRWNGIGIAAAEGTPVKAIASGQVQIAEPFGTYGLTVILQHPGGDYSVYGSLARIDVAKGQVVGKGDVLGAVGVADPELPPHLHFEVRPGGRAVDPLEWLRPQQ